MDLLATVRKEGSRGGTGDFKWEDVQNSSHREHYLGHSLHAPVGRWAKGKDLGWYAKGDAGETDETEDSAAKASRERAEEIRRIKEAEQDALSRALGLPVPVRSNPNQEPLGDRKEIDKLVTEATNEDGGVSGIGYSGSARPSNGRSQEFERIEGNAEQQDKELQSALKEYRRRHDEDRRKHRSRSRDRDRHHRRHGSRDREHHHRRRARSRDRDRDRQRRRLPSPDDREYGRHKHRDRSRSPRRHSDRHDHRDGHRR